MKLRFYVAHRDFIDSRTIERNNGFPYIHFKNRQNHIVLKLDKKLGNAEEQPSPESDFNTYIN